MGRLKGTVVLAMLLAMTWLDPSTVVEAQQQKRIDTIINWSGQLWHRFTPDRVNWSTWRPVHHTAFWFQDQPALVSDRPGHMLLVARTGTYERDVMVVDYHQASGWGPPRTIVRGPFFNFAGVSWELVSSPTVASWGANRFDVFFYARDGASRTALFHLYSSDGGNSWRWETLGTGLMQGSPSAVSNAPNRITVFARVDTTLIYKSWTGSTWTAWTVLDGVIGSDPSAVSNRANYLEVYVHGVDGTLWRRVFQDAQWRAWQPVALGHAIGSNPTAVMRSLNPEFFAFDVGYNTVRVYQFVGEWLFTATRDDFLKPGFHMAAAAYQPF